MLGYPEWFASKLAPTGKIRSAITDVGHRVNNPALGEVIADGARSYTKPCIGADCQSA